MAQTKPKKAKAANSRSAAGSKTARKPKRASRAQSRRRRSSQKKPAARDENSNGVQGGTKAVRDAVSTAGKGAGHAAGKAKIPLLAGGAALAGTVGGVIIGSTHSGGKVTGDPFAKAPTSQDQVQDLAKAAKEVGRFGENVGELTAEFRRVRQSLAGDGKQNSPLEILLKGFDGTALDGSV